MDTILKNITYTKPRGHDEITAALLSIVKKDYVILDTVNYLDSIKISISYEGDEYIIIAHTKRIHDNGFPNNRRPEIKRIQVRPIKEEMYTDSTQCFLLSGIVYYSGEPLLVVWNPFTFRGFAKNRSAYISTISLKNAFDEGFYYGADCETNVYVCRKGFFKNLLSKYIEDTKFEEIVW